MVVDLAEGAFLSQSSQEGPHHLRLSFLALLHCGHSRLSLWRGEIVDCAVGIIEGVLALEVGLPCVFEGHLFGLDSFVLEEQLSLGIGGEGGQSFGLDDAFGKGNGRPSQV